MTTTNVTTHVSAWSARRSGSGLTLTGLDAANEVVKLHDIERIDHMQLERGWAIVAMFRDGSAPRVLVDGRVPA